jgi:CopG-like RHH_1 or ribbon-helix-helix domain, RHH_5
VTTLIHPSLRRATKYQREPGIVVRSVVPRELADKLRERAARENRTLSVMIARLLARAVEKE